MEKKVLGPPLQQEIAEKWSHLTKEGMDDETRKTLIEKHPAPENSTFLNPPKLNEVVSSACIPSVIRRDIRLSNLQAQLGAGVSAIGTALNSIVINKEENRKIAIEALGDAARLLLDLFYQETKARQKLITINLNKDSQQVFQKASADEWLFGTQLEEKLKTSRDLARSSLELKLAKQTPKKNLNKKSPPRNHFKQGRQGGRQYTKKFNRGPRQRQNKAGQEKVERRYQYRHN